MRESLSSSSAVVAVVGVVALATYYSAAAALASDSERAFVFDDLVAIVENKDVTSTSLDGWNITQLFSHDFWGREMDLSEHKSYRPLTTLSFRLNWHLIGQQGRSFRLVNVLLHAIVSVAFTGIAGTVFFKESEDRWEAAMFAGLLFATHPVHVEAVASIVGRADVLSTGFFLLSLWLYSKFRDRGVYLTTKGLRGGFISPLPSIGLDEWVWLVAAVVAAGLALLCKEIGVTALGCCAAYDICSSFLIRETRRPTETKSNSVAAAAVTPFSLHGNMRVLWRSGVVGRVGRLAVLTIVVLSWRVAVNSGSPTFPLVSNPHALAEDATARLLGCWYLAARHWWLLIVPWPLCCDWSHGAIPLVQTLADPRNTLTAAFVACVAALVCHTVRTAVATDARKAAAGLQMLVGLAMTAIAFLPASNMFFPVGFVVAERVLYTPSVGGCVFAAAATITATKRDSPRRRTARLTLASVVAVFAAMSVSRSAQWSSGEKLFGADLATAPLNSKIASALGKELVQNYPVNSEQHARAEAVYSEAVRMNDAWGHDSLDSQHGAGPYEGLGKLFMKYGRFDEAERNFRMAVKFQPREASWWNVLGVAAKKNGRVTEAVASYQRALTEDPAYGSAYTNLGNIFLAQGDHAAAIETLETGARTLPEDASVRMALGRAVAASAAKGGRGSMEEAEKHFRQAASLAPDDDNVQLALAQHVKRDKRGEGRVEEARALLEAMLRRLPRSAQLHNSLGMLYAQDIRDHSKALRSFELAMELSPGVSSYADNARRARRQVEAAS